MRGFDVSKYQSRVTWPQTKSAGNDFVIMRSGDGMNGLDPMFESHYAGAKGVGLHVGAYHYFYYGDVDRHEKELANFLARIKGMVFELPVFLDYEEEGKNGYKISAPYLIDAGKAQLTNWVISDCAAIKAAGFRPGLYANAWWMRNHIDMTKLPADICIWCADISGAIDYKGRVDIHQYSFTGAVPGIAGQVDLNKTLATDAFILGTPATPAAPAAPAPTVVVSVDRKAVRVAGAPDPGLWRRHSPQQLGDTNTIDCMPNGQEFWATGITADGWYRIESGGWAEQCYTESLTAGELPLVNYVVPAPAPAPAIQMTLSVGQAVTINGSGAAASDGSGTKVKRTNKAGVIVRRIPGAKYPNGTNYTSGSGVDAWFPDSALALR